MTFRDYLDYHHDLIVHYLTSPTVNGHVMYREEPQDVSNKKRLKVFSKEDAQTLLRCFTYAYESGHACRSAMLRLVDNLSEQEALHFMILLYEEKKDIYRFLASFVRKLTVPNNIFELYYPMFRISEEEHTKRFPNEDFVTYLTIKNHAWRYDFLLRHLDQPRYHYLAEDINYDLKEPLETLPYRLCHIALGTIPPRNEAEEKFAMLSSINITLALESLLKQEAITIHEENLLL